MKENQDEYSIIVDNVYKTFNVYLDKANTIKEKLLFLFSLLIIILYIPNSKITNNK